MTANRPPPRMLLAIVAGVIGVAAFTAVFLAVVGRSTGRGPLIDRMPKVESAGALTDDEYQVPPVILVIAADGTLHIGHGPHRWAALGGEPSGDGDQAFVADLAAAVRRVKAGKHRQEAYVPDDVGEPSSIDTDVDPIPVANPPDSLDDGSPAGRLAEIHGKVQDSLPYETDTLVIAAPGAPATVLIDVFSHIDGAIAVAHDHKVHALRVVFEREPRPPPPVPGAELAPWAEVRFVAGGLEVEGVPDQPIQVALPLGGVEPLVEAYNQARERRGIGDRHDVDVLVAPDTTVQALVDVLIPLSEAGADRISIGRVPAAGSPAATRRGKRVATVHARYLSASDTIDTGAVHSAVEAHTAAMVDCYRTALAGDPNLSGTVTADLAVASDGTVTVEADGLTPDTGRCVAAALQPMTLPPTATSETIHVQYAISFRN